MNTFDNSTTGTSASTASRSEPVKVPKGATAGDPCGDPALEPILRIEGLSVALPAGADREYAVEELSTTRSGGGPYGASHVTWGQTPDQLSDEEKTIAKALGARVAQTALQLAKP